MADHLTLLENELDEKYATLRDRLVDPTFVPGWDDYNYRAGYLKAFRDIGVMIRGIRAPENVASEGISDVLPQEEVNG